MGWMEKPVVLALGKSARFWAPILSVPVSLYSLWVIASRARARREGTLPAPKYRSVRPR